jgi:hypothetical protein
VALLYVGVPAVTLYPLGLVGLGIRMWRDPLFPYYDFAAVWNAVSLVPHTLVVGTGIELLSLFPTFFGIGVASLTFGLLANLGLSLLAYNGVDGWDDLRYLAGFLLLPAGGGHGRLPAGPSPGQPLLYRARCRRPRCPLPRHARLLRPSGQDVREAGRVGYPLARL